MDRKQKLICPEWEIKGSSLHSDMEATLQQQQLFFFSECFRGKKTCETLSMLTRQKETSLRSDKYDWGYNVLLVHFYPGRSLRTVE